MKIKSLLAAVSMVAIAASSAHAITATQTNGDFAAPLALELNLAATPVPGTVTVSVGLTSGGTFAQGVLHTVNVQLPSGMAFAPGGASGLNITAGANAGSVFSGGAAGSSSVVYRISPPDNTVTNFTINLPVVVNSCVAQGSGVQVTVQDTAGFVENDADGDNTNSFPVGSGFGGCASAYDGTVNGTTASGTDTTIALLPTPTYTTLGGDSNVGTITYAIDPTVAVDAVGTPMALADIASVTSTITLAGNPAMGGATLTASTGVLTGGPNVWTLVQTAADANAGTQIDVFAGTAVLPNMQPVVGPATARFVTANGFITSEAGATGNLEALQREGQTFGAFDWNSGGDGAGTVSVYRITGLAPASTTVFSAELTNSSANGIVSGSVTADATGEAVLTSTTLGGVLPAGVTRYDFTLNLETGNTNVDVDRLLLRNGIVSAFNDGSNSSSQFQPGTTPTTDADNNGSE